MTDSDSTPAYLRRRIELTTSCRDADDLPRAKNAGGFSKHDGHDIQLMHNGVRVLRGGYYGAWMSEIIERLRGVHEPQEEKAVAAIFSRLAEQNAPTAELVCVELGSFWAYYSLWFLELFNDGRVVCLEPDPGFMEVGVTNFALNKRTATFVEGAIGVPAGTETDFIAESDGIARSTKLYTLNSLMAETHLSRIDVLFVDIQGAEIALLESAQEILQSGAVRFMVVSTHDMSLTKSPLTHRYAERLLRSAGAHIICEHSVSESFSADGLIVASFSEDDKDIRVELSRARAADSCFGEWEPRLDEVLTRVAQLESQLDEARSQSSQAHDLAEAERRRADEAARTVETLSAQRESEAEQLRAMRASLSWRITALVRWLGRPSR